MRFDSAALPLLALLLLPSLPASARSFDALQKKATAVTSLGSFLEDFVGECRDASERASCERNAKVQRKKLAGRLLYVRLPDRHSRLLQVSRELPDGRLRLALTPFFDAAGYGLSRGRPKRLDRRGNPRVRLVPLTVTLPDGLDRRRFELAMRTGNLRLELLFVPRSTWKLGRRAEGVAATFRGLRITESRTGRTVAEVLW